MAVGGRASFSINFDDFDKSLEVLISRVDRGTKKATLAAAQEIMANSLKEVPRDTGALASSAYYEIIGSYKNFSAELGYGKGNPTNKRGIPVQDYMVAVHEDLQAVHETGNAKFLENPVRRYQLEAKAGAIIQQEISD